MSSNVPPPIAPGIPKTWQSAEEAMAYLGVGRSTFYRLVGSEPGFPQPHYVTERNPRWRREALDAWLEGRQPAEAGA